MILIQVHRSVGLKRGSGIKWRHFITIVNNSFVYECGKVDVWYVDQVSEIEAVFFCCH